MDRKIYDTYLSILNKELVPAMGCTEPISLAYAAALARKTLGEMPLRTKVFVSSNIIKNVKSVIVPHTGGLQGIASAVAAGITVGNADKKLEVLSEVKDEQVPQISEYLNNYPIEVAASDSGYIFDIQVVVFGDLSFAKVQISGSHTNVVRIEKDGKELYRIPYTEESHEASADRKCLNIEGITEFADTVRIEDVKELLDRQIHFNTAIAEEGLKGNWGANIGRILLKSYGNAVHVRAKAMAAAGSDARMGGCEKPVVINSGSGNQGLTTSLPVIEYAKELKVSYEKLYRSLVVANLVTIHLKTGIGRLSAYCGATSAGCGAGAGIMYLHGGNAEDISHVIVNAVAINSGMICDGAKASCAAKIASAVEAGLMGVYMRMNDSEFFSGDGIVMKGVENTIRNVGRLAHDGMAETDKEIISIMIDQ